MKKTQNCILQTDLISSPPALLIPVDETISDLPRQIMNCVKKKGTKFKFKGKYNEVRLLIDLQCKHK